MRKSWMALAFALASIAAQAQPIDTPSDPDPHKLHIAITAMLAAQGAELATTMYALGSGRATEANPAFRPLTKQPWAAGAVKMTVAAGTAYLMLKYHREHPKLTFWTTVAMTAGYTALAVHNARAIR